MECAEARRLLDQGVVPGARTPIGAQLGFHLARCAACRARRNQVDALLASLLDQPPPPPSRLEPTVGRGRQATISTLSAGTYNDQVVAQRHLPPVVSRGSALERLLWTSGGVFALGLLLVVIWLGGIAQRAQANLAAIVVTTTVPQPTQQLPRPVAVGAGLAVGPLVGPEVAAPLPSPSLPPTTRAAPTANMAIAQASPTAQPTGRSIATATPWPTLEPPVPTVPPATATLEVAVPPPGEPFTVLLLGNDRRPGEAGIPRTDAIIVARIDPQLGRIALLSFPRDLWVTIPGYGQSRINAAYVWGESYGAPGGGLELAKATVSNLIGRPIDYVAMVDFEAFIGLIDSIGGVTVDVEKVLDDPQFPTMDYGYTHVHFEPGPQQMNGVTALTYSRIRHPDSDFARIKRQQMVLIAIGQRLQERGDLQNLLSADTITGALRGYAQTDMPQERIFGAVWALRGLQPAQVERYTLDADGVSFGVGNDRYAEVALPGVVETLVARLYGELSQ